MRCLINFFIVFPMYITLGCFYMLYIVIMLSLYFLQVIIYIVNFIIAFVIELITKKRYSNNMKKPTINIKNFTTTKNSSPKRQNTKIFDTSYEEKKFEEEAELWGLSEEDKRIAKQERMSPADFIEAEERDDDLLDTDEF